MQGMRRGVHLRPLLAEVPRQGMLLGVRLRQQQHQVPLPPRQELLGACRVWRWPSAGPSSGGAKWRGRLRQRTRGPRRRAGAALKAHAAQHGREWGARGPCRRRPDCRRRGPRRKSVRGLKQEFTHSTRNLSLTFKFDLAGAAAGIHGGLACWPAGRCPGSSGLGHRHDDRRPGRPRAQVAKWSRRSDRLRS